MPKFTITSGDPLLTNPKRFGDNIRTGNLLGNGLMGGLDVLRSQHAEADGTVYKEQTAHGHTMTSVEVAEYPVRPRAKSSDVEQDIFKAGDIFTVGAPMSNYANPPVYTRWVDRHTRDSGSTVWSDEVALDTDGYAALNDVSAVVFTFRNTVYAAWGYRFGESYPYYSRSRLVLEARDADTGVLYWSISTTSENQLTFVSGICSDGEKVYVKYATTLSVAPYTTDSVLACYDAQTGAELWTMVLATQLLSVPEYHTLIINGNSLYLTIYGRDELFIQRRDKTDGDLQWQTSIACSGTAIRASIVAHRKEIGVSALDFGAGAASGLYLLSFSGKNKSFTHIAGSHREIDAGKRYFIIQNAGSPPLSAFTLKGELQDTYNFAAGVVISASAAADSIYYSTVYYPDNHYLLGCMSFDGVLQWEVLLPTPYIFYACFDIFVPVEFKTIEDKAENERDSGRLMPDLNFTHGGGTHNCGVCGRPLD